MDAGTSTVYCPMCSYQATGEYDIVLHMEKRHSEGGGSFFIADPELQQPQSQLQRQQERIQTQQQQTMETLECPIDGCAATLTLAELEDHVNMHSVEVEDVAEDPEVIECPVDGCYERVGVEVLDRHLDRHAMIATGSREYRSPYAVANATATAPVRERDFNEKADETKGVSGGRRFRLGTFDLGKHAYEDRMPESLVAMLTKGKYTSAEGIIPVLSKLLDHSSSTEFAYLCHPAVQHISMLRGEGGFCGYRNIQMLTSYIIGNRAEGVDRLGEEIPSIFQIQDYIENAWDMGINASGRIETGGIRGTRKYIGTPEAQAMFQSLKIPTDVKGFKSTETGVSEARLLAAIQSYFESSDVPFNPQDRVRRTHLPPVYFQHRGHSLTIVGIEKRRGVDGLNLLVFDPMHDPRRLARLVGRDKDGKLPAAMRWYSDGPLNLYRRGNKYLRRFHEFEILKLRPEKLF